MGNISGKTPADWVATGYESQRNGSEARNLALGWEQEIVKRGQTEFSLLRGQVQLRVQHKTKDRKRQFFKR